MVVLLGAVAAFMITAHMGKEEDARMVVGSIFKVVVMIVLSWALSVFALEQAKSLEKAIYTI
jgi:hypothetical protein